MPTPFPFVSGAVLQAAQLNAISELPTRTLTGSGVAVAADSYSRVILNGTSITYTINTSTFSAGQVVEIYNANSTTATIAAGAGITLNGAAGLTLVQYQTAQLYAVSATSFVLSKSDSPNKIVQIVTGNTSTEATSSVATYADTNLTATITPTSASNKILIVVTQNGLVKTSGNAANGLNLKLLRGATEIQRFAASMGYTNSATSNYMGSAATQFLDSPATTSATTYKTTFANDVTAAAVRVQDGSGTNSTIVLYEVTP